MVPEQGWSVKGGGYLKGEGAEKAGCQHTE
jgi:hypothetical protein